MGRWAGIDPLGGDEGIGYGDEGVQRMEWMSVSLPTLSHITFAADPGFSA